MPRGAVSGIKKGALRRGKTLPASAINLMFDGPSTSRFNKYSVLADHADMEVTTENNTNTSNIVNKPPPIVVDSAISLREVQHLLGRECTFKRTNIGTKVFPATLEKYNFCKKSLLENNIEFHSFNSKENRLFSTFLCGLPKIDTVDIVEELKSYNLNPTAVTEIQTKYSSDDDAVYKVQFMRKDFNPASLRNIKTILDVVIAWKRFKPNKTNRATQCWNCLMYGHGGQHCNRKVACMTCANNHNSTDCPFIKNNKKPAAFTCFNCKKYGKEKTDHSANDPNCPFRFLYLETRAQATKRQQKQNYPKRHQKQQQPNYSYNESEYPAIHGHSNRERNYDRTYAQEARRNMDNNNKSHLFRVDELFEIFLRAVNDLNKCTNKIQQMQVVMSLVKNAYDIK